jgi:hypothetical protein
VHGKNEVVVEDVLDIRPFDYYTVRHTPRGAPASLLMTFQFAPRLQGGTHLCLTFKGSVAALPDWAGRWLCHWAVKNQIQRLWAFDRINSMIQAETATEAPQPTD